VRGVTSVAKTKKLKYIVLLCVEKFLNIRLAVSWHFLKVSTPNSIQKHDTQVVKYFQNKMSMFFRIILVKK